VVGAGEVVRTIHLPVLRHMSEVEIEWICDVDERRAERLARAYGVSRYFGDVNAGADVDAILLAVPVGVRRDAWQCALERGWNVLCEKPGARGIEEFELLIEEMSSRGLVVAVGLMRRFYAGTRLVQQLLEKRTFGEVREVWAGEGGRQTRTGRGNDWYQVD